MDVPSFDLLIDSFGAFKVFQMEDGFVQIFDFSVVPSFVISFPSIQDYYSFLEDLR